MNKVLFENKVKVLERLVLQDIVECYSQQRYSEKSYDGLMAKLLDRLTGFYEELELDSVSLRRLNQYGNRAKIYTEKLREDLDKATEVTVRQIVKQLPREKLSVATQWDVIQVVRPVLRRRTEVLGSLLSASSLQMKNYMLLWDYQDEGFTHYCLLTEGENCDDCNSLEGQIFPISEARVGENFPPMHPNCNCRVGILNGAGQVAYIISEGKAEKNEEETNWYDAFLRMPQDAKELFLAFANSQDERFGRGDLAGFLDWLTMGIVSGTWQGYQDRYQELLNDPTLYSFVNYLTSGLADTVKGAITPEEPLSLQHWLDSLGTASTAFGVYQAGKSLKGTSTIKSNAKTETKKVLGEIDDVTNGIKYFEDIQLTTEPNTAYFWSGMGEDGAGIAASIAKRNNGVTLEVTIDRNAINIPKWDFDNPDSIRAWQAASESFAKQASGEVKVVLGRNVSPHSIWATKELPLLMKNQNVTKIIKIDPETLKETIIFMR